MALTNRDAINTVSSNAQCGKAADEAQSLSYRFQMGKRSITYSGDTGPSDAFAALAAGADLLVSEIIDLEAIVGAIRERRKDMAPQVFDQMRRHLSSHHITATDLGKLVAKARPGRLVLTHFAIPPGPLSQSEAGFRGDIAQSWKGSVDLARDLSSYDVGCP